MCPPWGRGPLPSFKTPTGHLPGRTVLHAASRHKVSSFLPVIAQEVKLEGGGIGMGKENIREPFSTSDPSHYLSTSLYFVFFFSFCMDSVASQLLFTVLSLPSSTFCCTADWTSRPDSWGTDVWPHPIISLDGTLASIFVGGMGFPGLPSMVFLDAHLEQNILTSV